MRPKKYTVLLAYPDYLTDGRSESYAAWVCSRDEEEAVSCARRKAGKDNEMEPEELDDLAVIAVYEGHLIDRKSGKVTYG